MNNRLVKRVWQGVAIAACFVLSAGCVHFSQISATALNFDPATMGFIGPVSATVSEVYVFGVGESDESIVHTAKKMALDKYGADELLNPLIEDNTLSLLGIFMERTVKVSGTAIKYRVSGLTQEGTIQLKKDQH